MRRGDDFHPSRGWQFVGAQVFSHTIIKDFGRRARNAAEPLVFHHLQIIVQAHSCFCDAVIDFHRRERMHMHFGNRALDRAEEIAVEKSFEIARQSALDANLGGAAFPGFADAANDFVE